MPAVDASAEPAAQRRRPGFGFWAVAFAFLIVTAFATVPSPLYGLYRMRDNLSAFTITVIYAIFAGARQIRRGSWLRNRVKGRIHDEIPRYAQSVSGALWGIDSDKVNRGQVLKIIGSDIHKQLIVRNPNTVRKLYALMRADTISP